MHLTRNKPELLAPAGDWEAMRAAVANGADAVYFGLSNFNARARAANFTPEELPDVMRFLHARNVKGFVTLNTLIFSDELPAVAEFVKLCAELRRRCRHSAGPRTRSAHQADRADAAGPCIDTDDAERAARYRLREGTRRRARCACPRAIAR